MKYAGIETITSIVNNIKEKFASIQHVHEINEINGLQQRFDDLSFLPDIETSDDVLVKVVQLSNSVSTLTDMVNKLMPAIGEIYITLSDENPSLKFGGTWEQIKDTFLLASGDVYATGSIGGEAMHTLTIDEMPAHTHALTRPQWSRTEPNGTETDVAAYGVTNKTDTNMFEGTTGNIYETGGGQPHNNMPPYLAVYVWKRVA